MRQRMEPAIERGRAPGVDIKRGTGGIVDVEFIAQILLLAHGHLRKGLRHANTLVVLERMIGERLLSPPTDANCLVATRGFGRYSSQCVLWIAAATPCPTGLPLRPWDEPLASTHPQISPRNSNA
ncbi:MAG: hypothetical protein CME24_12750 [Gemmatimonadetes bacterium]|nr:hypothetical protein [Gemmatimonadota bacterium]